MIAKGTGRDFNLGVIAHGRDLSRTNPTHGLWSVVPGCHQIAERCLDFGFGPLAVCARCLGLYLGGCIGLIFMTARCRLTRPPVRWLFILSVPTLIDFVMGQLGSASLGNWPRLVLAVPPAVLAAIYLGDAVIAELRSSPTMLTKAANCLPEFFSTAAFRASTSLTTLSPVSRISTG